MKNGIKAKVAVLVSGGGTNLQALIDKCSRNSSYEISIVIANKENVYALARARINNIKTETVLKKDFNTQEEFENKLIEIIDNNNIDLIVLAGFLCILSKHFTSKYEKRIINVHPSLIPQFCGKGAYGIHVHEQVLKAGVKKTGATVHFVNEIPDGGEIITQKEVEVKNGDTPEILQKRVMEQAEWQILPEAVEKISKEICKLKGEVNG